MSKTQFCFFKVVNRKQFPALLAMVAALATGPSLEAQTNLPPLSPNRAEETNAQELRTYLQLQEQMHATQLAIERNRKETDEAATQNAKILATRLQGIEQALATQRAHELEVMQNSNRVMLIVAGCFAGMGFLAMLLMAYFQWRTVNRLAEISAALPGSLALTMGRPLPALGIGERQFASPGAPERLNPALLETVARLEQRILELEHTSHPPLGHENAPSQDPAAEPSPANGDTANGSTPHTTASAEPPAEAARVTVLLGKGQSLLNLDKAEEAMACFDAVLALDPAHPEALVKKGAALERLRKLTEAIECYDRAIASDGSLTIAYLYKGGVFNRMERFTEALECYEQALRTQEKRRG